jgi:tetratricopeptide (TPR) repeat protein
MKPPLEPSLASSLAAAQSLIQTGRLDDAVLLLQALVQSRPKSAEVHKMLAAAGLQRGDLAGADQSIRKALGLNRRDLGSHILSGQICLAGGQVREAETAFRAALGLDRRSEPAATALCELLVNLNRADEALKATAPLVLSSGASATLLAAHAAAQNAAGQVQASLDTSLKVLAKAPNSAVAEHNIAARLGDLSRHEEAEAATRRAFAKGLDAPETWLVHGRALQGQDRFEEAEAAYRRAIATGRGHPDAQLELAQLIWMQTGDLTTATKGLHAGLAADPLNVRLALHLSSLQTFAGDRAGAFATLTAAIERRGQFDPVLAVATANAALAVRDLAVAEILAARVLQALPSHVEALRLSCDVNLALGRLEEAQAAALSLRRLVPLDQSVLARLATVWRLAGDGRYHGLYDYDRMVGCATIETPQGWSSLSAYLADLAEAVEALHRLKAHPVGQSLRGGSQTMQNLALSQDPAIRAFFVAIDPPIRAYLQALGQGKDALRQRHLGAYQLSGSWSVRLKANGFHADHVHPKGWLSSAFYVDTPRAIEAGGKEGWIKFGQPGLLTRPELEADHWVKPEPGRLVLFPSFMWHGTQPFSSDERRLTIAFDLLPQRSRPT